MINAQNYAQMTSKIDLSQLTKDQQNFHALVQPHIVQFEKDVTKDSDPRVKAKLDAYYNFLSVKLQGNASTTTSDDAQKRKMFEFRKRKQLQLALAANANK